MVWSALAGLSGGQAALVGGGLSLLGSLGSAKMSQASANKQMDFQAAQTGTGYQRAMDDMRAAGLNPMLAAKLGPAASGSGAMAQIPDFGQAVSRGAQAASSTAQANKVRAEEQLVEVNTSIRRLDKLVKQLKEVPAARVSGFKDRIVSIVIKDLDSVVQFAKNNASYTVPQKTIDQLEQSLKGLKSSSRTVFNEVLEGLDKTSKEILRGLLNAKELLQEIK